MRHLLWVCMCMSVLAKAQVDSLWLIHLPAAEIQDDRLQRFAQGHHQLQLDSADIALQGYPTVDRLVTHVGGLFIRDYGPAGLSLPSFRGTGPQHTAVLWNGIPLNSPMNGVIDLSLLPAWLFNDVSLQMGGSAALWGSGAIGGAIHLNQKIAWQQPTSVKLMAQAGSFGQQNWAFSWQQSTRRFHTRTMLQHRRATNNYPLFHSDGTRWYRQPHATTGQTDVSQENAIRLSGKDVLIWRLWWQQADRELPPSTGATWNGGFQGDRNLRTMATWQHTASSYRWEWRLAALRESFQYNDFLQTDPARSEATTYLTEGTLTGSWRQRWHWQGGVTGQQAIASADGYDGQVSQLQAAAYVHLLYQTRKWEAGSQLRQGAAAGYQVPLAGSLWVRRTWRPGVTTKAQINRDFRLPTLNDRYWIPGGNQDLQPETSIGQELGIRWEKSRKNISWHWESAAYHRQVAEWILWTPQQGFWQARNILQVRTYGLETSLSATRTWKSFAIDITGHYQWTKAIDQSNNLQLIYTPQHQGMLRIKGQTGPLALQYIHRYTGERFIATDNSSKLPSFQVSQVSICYTSSIGRHQLITQGFIDNLWQTQYDIIPGRRMPGRSFNLSLQLLLHPIYQKNT